MLNPEVANSWRLKTLNLQSHELRESAKFGDMMEDKFGSHGAWRLPEREHSRTSKKQSQSCRLRKSGFNVWTSGRLVNVWDVKDICVCVHTRNILWVQGYCRNVKVPSSPYKRGHEGTCKRIHNFGNLSSLQEILSFLLRRHCLNVFTPLSLVFRDLIQIFGYPPTVASVGKHPMVLRLMLVWKLQDV
jgi:hypothetical protein